MKSKMKICAWIVAAFAAFTGLTSCESDDDQVPLEQTNMEKAQEILDGEIVFSTRATMNGVDKTLVAAGCPTKFCFVWNADGTLTIEQRNFSVGSMPLAINFSCNVQFMNLDSWEQDEYPGKGWIKFKGTNGKVTYVPKISTKADAESGAGVSGYLNVNTRQVEFIIDYNMMNVRSEAFLQEIDKTRINRFEEEFAQYEKEYAKLKEEQGRN